MDAWIIHLLVLGVFLALAQLSLESEISVNDTVNTVQHSVHHLAFVLTQVN